MNLQRVTLVSTPNGRNLPEALSTLRESGLDVEVQYCSDKVAEWFICPFIRDSTGQTFFGIEGIEYFVRSKFAG